MAQFDDNYFFKRTFIIVALNVSALFSFYIICLLLPIHLLIFTSYKVYSCYYIALLSLLSLPYYVLLFLLDQFQLFLLLGATTWVFSFSLVLIQLQCTRRNMPCTTISEKAAQSFGVKFLLQWGQCTQLWCFGLPLMDGLIRPSLGPSAKTISHIGDVTWDTLWTFPRKSSRSQFRQQHHLCQD